MDSVLGTIHTAVHSFAGATVWVVDGGEDDLALLLRRAPIIANALEILGGSRWYERLRGTG